MSHGVLIALIVALLALVAVTCFVVVRQHMHDTPDLDFSRGRDVYDIARGPAAGVVGAPQSAESAGEADMRSRLKVFAGVVGAFFGALLVRLWGMQLLSGSRYTEQAEQNQTREVSLAATRGRILDRNGSVLVGNRSSMALVADKAVADDSRLVRRISNLLGMPEVAVRHNVQSENEGAQALRTIMIDVPENAVAYVVEHPSQFPGVQVEVRSVRSYPYGTMAAHLLGYTGSITREELDAFAEDDDAVVEYQSGDTVGKSGIEYQYESVLQGVRGVRTVHVNAQGDVTAVVGEVPSEAGSDVRLTIDANIQQAAEDAIQTGLACGRKLGYEPTGGACVCVNCKTGEVLALASYPTFDPSSFIGGISTDAWAQLIAAESNSPLLNRVIDGQYPSASTIKPLTACAALESGIAGYDSTYYCSGRWTGLGEQYGMYCWDHSGHGGIDLYGGITNSCDTVFYEIAKAFAYSDDPEGIQAMYRRWGLGEPTGVDLPSESTGRVPDAQWKWDYYVDAPDEARMWQAGDTANIAIGQGDILVTPLQMCHVYCGLVNGGVQMWPHILLDVLSNDTHEPLVVADRRVERTVEIDQGILSFVDQALCGVVSDTYVGDYFQGMPVGVMGKSGTGEAGDDEDNTHAWFVAAAPSDDPEYVVAALVEHGGGGGEVASHVCRQVLGSIYGVEMTDALGLLSKSNVSTTEVMD